MTSELSLQTHSTTLPAGYHQRAATPGDAEVVAHLHNVAAQARGEDTFYTTDLIVNRWENPPCDLPTSSQVIVNSQGEIVACLSLWDAINPAHPWYEWEVMPGDEWSTLTRALLEWGEQRALQALARCQPEERFAPAMAYNANASEQVAFIESLGYTRIRYFYRMAITLQEPPTVLPMPEGFTLRTFDYPVDLEPMVIAREEMWQDHYAYVEHDLEETLMTWKYGIEYDPGFDAKLWFIATDNATGEIAGLVLCRIEDPTNTHQGYIHVVGVRRAYRKHGLAQAMLTHAFAEFWARDQKTIALGVDASSPTGATRLYERVGMRPVYQSVFLEKEMRDGIERMNTAQ
jgi:mycothiol synthase